MAPGLLDGDALRLALRFGLLRQANRQHAVLEGRLHLVRVNVLSDGDPALEGAFPALAVEGAVLFQALLALQRQYSIVERHVDVALLEARSSATTLISSWVSEISMCGARGGIPRHLEVAQEIIEHPIHFPMKCQEQARAFRESTLLQVSVPAPGQRGLSHSSRSPPFIPRSPKAAGRGTAFATAPYRNRPAVFKGGSRFAGDARPERGSGVEAALENQTGRSYVSEPKPWQAFEGCLPATNYSASNSL